MTHKERGNSCCLHLMTNILWHFLLEVDTCHMRRCTEQDFYAFSMQLCKRLCEYKRFACAGFSGQQEFVEFKSVDLVEELLLLGVESNGSQGK